MRYLGTWLAACMFVAFTVALVLGPLLAPGPGRPRPPVQTAATTTGGPHPPEPTRDPFDPAWTPPDGRWHDALTFHDEAQRHPCMIGAVA